MIILVQSCLLRHGFISAVGVSLNDCQFATAAFFSMHKKRGYPLLHPLTLFRLPPPPYSSSSTSAHLSFVHSLCLCPHSTSLTATWYLLLFYSFLIHFTPELLFLLIFTPLTTIYPSFSSPFFFSFLKILNYPGCFCLAAPPPLSRLLSFLSTPPSPSLSWPCSLTPIIFHYPICFLVIMGLDLAAITKYWV